MRVNIFQNAIPTTTPGPIKTLGLLYHHKSRCCCPGLAVESTSSETKTGGAVASGRSKGEGSQGQEACA
ncbi:hypothetical protein TNCT_315461 [Trichonephila clavata]|uniref:Uncharacterized protein n=1 Tax=Trichonephila clavata TaxID=2740835 RepID=A0A8X6GZW0_TRICU|nr:hypothetical protein TNCT_315461 [Trichonephila clavata]